MSGLAKTIKNAMAKDNSQSYLSMLIDRSAENRCSVCNCLFFKGSIGEGTIIEVKCPRCGQMICFGKQYE